MRQSIIKIVFLAGAVAISAMGVSPGWANWQASDDGEDSVIAQTAAVESFDLPIDAVKALMAPKGCKATENEIFDAITGAGFGMWDANLFIANGADNGTLELIDKTDGVHTYRLGGGCAGRT